MWDELLIVLPTLTHQYDLIACILNCNNDPSDPTDKIVKIHELSSRISWIFDHFTDTEQMKGMSLNDVLLFLSHVRNWRKPDI